MSSDPTIASKRFFIAQKKQVHSMAIKARYYIICMHTQNSAVRKKENTSDN